MNQWLKYLPRLDPRSLSLFRIILGITLLLDLIFFRFVNLEAFYTDNGILPRLLAEKLGNSSGYTSLTPLSPLFIDGSTAFVTIFFILAGLSYIALILGLKTKWATVSSFFFLFSIQHRSCIVVETDDRMLLCLVFWAIFLPLNQYFSLDNRLKKVKFIAVSKLASFALLLQVALIYFCNGFPKTGEAWTSGKAMKYAMMEDIWINSEAANWLLQYEDLCYFITKATPPFEIILAILILTPLIWTKMRLLIVLSILLFHWGISIFLSFGFLPLIATCWAIAMLPPGFWENYSYNLNSIIINPVNNAKKYIKSGIIALLIFICTWQSFTHMPWMFKLNSFLPKHIKKSALFNQGWILYAPDLQRNIGWVQVFGIKENGEFIDIHSRQSWSSKGELIPYYQQECWQNFVQYHMYYQPHYQEIANSWLDWEIKKAKDDGIIITTGGIIHFQHYISQDGTLTSLSSHTLFTKTYN